MRHLPDQEYKWILHLVDHWSKFHFAFPLVRKTAREVADALEKWVFPVMGLPSILHSDNGREFVNKLIDEVLATWPGQVQLVSGRPRHPQSQGLIEQAHYTLERMLSAKTAESKLKSPPWSRWLPHIVCKFLSMSAITYTHIYTHGIFSFADTLNTQVHEVTKHTPYELAFGQPPRSLVIPDPNFSGKIAEEDLENSSPDQDGDSESVAGGGDDGQDGDSESAAGGVEEGQDGDSESAAGGGEEGQDGDSESAAGGGEEDQDGDSESVAGCDQVRCVLIRH